VSNRSIGVDIGSTGVRAAEVEWNGKKLKVLRVAEVPLPRGVVVAGEVRDPDALTAAVKLLWKQTKFSSKTVSIGMGGPQTLVRQVDLPWEPAEIFREALPLRVGSDLPVDPLEMTLDYHPLEEKKQGNFRIQRALVVGSLNAAAENASDALLAAGLKIKRADFIPFALIRAAVATAGDGNPVPGPQGADEEWPCEVVVDVGGQITVVAVHYRGRPLFIRVVPAGSDAVTRALAEHVKISLDTAEAMKHYLGISNIADEAVELSEDDDLYHIKAAIADVSPQQREAAQHIVNAMAGHLVQVVRESVEYFLAASPNITGVSRVLLSGGGTLLSGYAERLASELRAPVAFLAPIAAFGTGEASEYTDFDPRMTDAIGLALEVK
jgi:type IV pilus assembly protein PilM